MTRRSLLLLAGWFALLGPAVLAADWPQWRGPNRDDVSLDKGLLQKWPENGPKLLWTYENAGAGYSAPAIVGDRLYCMGARNGDEYVYALDLSKNGGEVWATKIGPMFTWKGDVWNAGPSATPSVDGDLLYALGGQGQFVCLETKTGALKWQKNLPADMKAEVNDSAPGGPPKIGWGFTWSPLVDGEQVILAPGGQDGLLAALNKKTGEVVWQSKEVTDQCIYASPIAADFNGVHHYIYATNEGIYGIGAKDGKVAWSWKRPRPFKDVLIPTPIYHDGLIYDTGGFNLGCVCLKLTANGKNIKAAQVYAKRDIQDREGGVVLVEGHVYGHSERPGWSCQDLKTGTLVWSSKELERGAITYADNRLYCYDEEGEAALVVASPEMPGFKLEGRFTIPKRSALQAALKLSNGKTWTHPVVANGRLYLRDHELLFCYDVKK